MLPGPALSPLPPPAAASAPLRLPTYTNRPVAVSTTKASACALLLLSPVHTVALVYATNDGRDPLLGPLLLSMLLSAVERPGDCWRRCGDAAPSTEPPYPCSKCDVIVVHEQVMASQNQLERGKEARLPHVPRGRRAEVFARGPSRKVVEFGCQGGENRQQSRFSGDKWHCAPDFLAGKAVAFRDQLLPSHHFGGLASAALEPIQ